MCNSVFSNKTSNRKTYRSWLTLFPMNKIFVKWKWFIFRVIVVLIYAQHVVVQLALQLKWLMSSNHKDYGMFQKQEKPILEMIEMIVMIALKTIIVATINKNNMYLTFEQFYFPFFSFWHYFASEYKRTCRKQ